MKLVGTDTRSAIVREAQRLLDDPAAYAAMAKAFRPTAMARPPGRIVEVVLKQFT